MFSGELYILNALYLGVALVVGGYFVKPVGRIMARLVYWCMPVGIVLLYDLATGMHHYMTVHRHDEANENVTPINKGNGK